jgi:predicted pyridoxine 5'-phosphate oxidase superfamily flavin-nucleotide-binding protein
MTNILSDWAREFLREDHVAVGSTLNKDGSPFVTTIWYLLQEDGTVIYHLFCAGLPNNLPYCQAL